MILDAIVCSVLLTPGLHALECKAEYLHTIGGIRYWHEVTHGQLIIGNQQANCSGEGHPQRVTMKDLGAVVCRAEVFLFSDGFESGSTTAWTSVVPQSHCAGLLVPRTRILTLED